MFMHVCGHMYTSVFDGCQEKVGQRISHHLLRGEGERGKERRRGERRGQEKKEKKMRQETMGWEEKRAGEGRGEEIIGTGRVRSSKSQRWETGKGRGNGKKRCRLSPSVTTDGLGSAHCIRLPSDERQPLTLTFGLCLHTHTITHFLLCY